MGIKPSEEFINYVRTEKHGQCTYSKIAQSLNFNKDAQRHTQAYVPPVNPFDVNFHRAKRNKVAGAEGSTMNAFQEEVGQALRNLTSGSLNTNALRQQLKAYNVPIDAHLDKLLRRHDAGDFVTYNEIGKHVFR